MPQMEVGSTGVEAHLEFERFALLKACYELCLGDNLRDTSFGDLV